MEGVAGRSEESHMASTSGRNGRPAYVVLGSPCSGGSEMARILSLAGVRLPRDLFAPDPAGDPAGFGEARSVVQLNDDVLASWGGSWRQPPPAGTVSQEHRERARWVVQRMFPQQGAIILKDPRLSLTGTTWLDALEQAGLVPFLIIMHRDPSAVASSLCEICGLERRPAYQLWRTYVEGAMKIAMSRPHAVVAYLDVVEDARVVLSRLGAPPPAGGWEGFNEAARAFIPQDPGGEEAATADGAASEEEHALKRELDRLSALEPLPPEPVAKAWDARKPVTWLLISGAPRSGTTLLRALVDDHPEAAILQEFGLTRFVRGLSGLVGRPPSVHPPWAPFAGAETVLERAAAFYEEREAAGGGGSHGDLALVAFDALAQGLFTSVKASQPRVIGDKMPMRGDWEDVDYLLQRLPGLRLLVILRNPRAVINSSLIRRARQQRGGDIWPITSVQEAAEEWWLACRLAAELVDRLGSAAHIVKYETLCEDADGVMRGVWDWLDLPVHASATLIRRLPEEINVLTAEEAGAVEALLGEVATAWDEEPDPRRLLQRFSASPRPYVPGRRLLAASEDADPVFVEGFSWREAWGRWTDGDCAMIRLRHGLAGGQGVLELQVARTFAPEGACDVLVTANGAAPQLFSLGEGPGRLALLCPLDGAATPGVLEVKLLLLRPKGVLDPPADERRLGLGVEAVCLRVLP